MCGKFYTNENFILIYVTWRSIASSIELEKGDAKDKPNEQELQKNKKKSISKIFVHV